MPDRFCLPSVSFATRYGLAKPFGYKPFVSCLPDAWREVCRERPLSFAPIGSEKYGWKNTFAVIEFAKLGAAGLFFSS